MAAAIQLSERTIATFAQAGEIFRPPPKLTVTQWAERERILSSETSSTTGQYRASIAPYQRAMQDAANIPGVEQIVLFTSAQIGKSMCLENQFGYFASEDPCPMIYMWPTDQVAKDWSVDTLAPILRDTPVLTEIFEIGSRSTATAKTLFKKFPGGWLAIIGSNAASNLRRRRARVVICEEIDAYKASAGSEGDPILLVWKRATTFWNRLLILASTCTEKGDSRIEAAYEYTNKQKYWVPCPHCSQAAGHSDGFQVFKWKRLVFPKEEPTIENVVYPCEHCGAALTEFDKKWMNAHGEWRAERPEITKRVGFWIHEMYSPFVAWWEMVKAFLEAVSHRENPNLLKTFINLSLAETWEEEGLKLDGSELMKRREEYPPPALPHGVTVLTCGVDVQPDRLELEVVGWGKGEETWSVDFKRFTGDTSKLEGTRAGDGTPIPSVWEELRKFLTETRYMHALGIRKGIDRTFVDSGFNTQTVYQFTKQMQEGGAGVFASKGVSGFGRPPVGKWTKPGGKTRARMYPVGVDVIKETVYARLRIQDPGAGYMHFSTVLNDADYFDQLTAEKQERKYKHGFPVRVWTLPAGRRNEALDCRVYATAAFLSLHSNPARMLADLRKDFEARARLAAADRRAHIVEGQLPLGLGNSAEKPADPDRVQQQQDQEAPEPPVNPEEYKVAEAVEQKTEPKEAEEMAASPRRIVARKGGWL
jgi:phage terminase large subunit GpA-like protein